MGSERGTMIFLLEVLMFSFLFIFVLAETVLAVFFAACKILLDFIVKAWKAGPPYSEKENKDED